MRQFLVFTSVMICVGLFIVTQASSQQPATTPAAAPPTTPVTAAPAAPATATPPVASTPVTAAPTTQVVAPVTADTTIDPVRPTEADQPAGKILFDDSKYVDPTYSNLARLYWGLGILDINNAKLVDNFLAITECNMYLQYINNDLEWQDVRQATRDYLRKNYKLFPSSFRITIPLYLGRYNADEEFFEVNMERSATNAVRNIETVYYTKPVTCGQTGDLDGYPRNLVLYLNRPFSLPEVPVERELARLYLDDSNASNPKRMMDANRKARAEDSERMAFLELMFRAHSFKENRATMGGFTKAVVYAEIDYIRVYADYEKHKLLFEKDMFEEEGRKRRKREGATTSETLQLPEGHIFSDPKKATKPVAP